MAIAGIEAEHVTELYTTEQVREILIKFAEYISVDEDFDYNWKEEFDYNWKEELELIGFRLMIGSVAVDGDDGIAEAVDVFMKGE